MYETVPGIGRVLRRPVPTAAIALATIEPVAVPLAEVAVSDAVVLTAVAATDLDEAALALASTAAAASFFLIKGRTTWSKSQPSRSRRKEGPDLEHDDDGGNDL